MKRNINRLMTTLLSLLLIVSLVVPVTASTTPDSNEKNIYDFFFPEDLLLDESFMEFYEAHLINEFGEVFMSNLESARTTANDFLNHFEINDLGNPKFPEFIGGIYFDKDGNLVILVVDNLSRVDVYAPLARLLDTTDVIMRTVEFSDIELCSVMRVVEHFAVMPYCYFNAEVRSNFVSARLGTIENRVIVDLLVYSESEIQRFRNYIIDSPTLYFRQAPEKNREFLSHSFPTEEMEPNELNDLLRAAIQISPGAPFLGGSMAYRVIHPVTGQRGFITAAHIVSRGQIIPNVGTVRNWNSSGGVHAAFVDTHLLYPVHTSTNEMRHPTNPMIPLGALSLAIRVPIVGDLVTRLGMGMSTGRVTNIRAITFGLEGNLINQIDADLFSEARASGGIVFCAYNRATLGVVIQGVPGGRGIYATRAQSVYDMFGLRRQ